MKDCNTCGKRFDLDQYYVNRAMEDGLSRMCIACTKAYNKEYALRKNSSKPTDWKQKTTDAVAYARAYRLANLEKIRTADRIRGKRRTPEQERNKYERKMRRLHGDDWQPKKLLSPDDKKLRQKSTEIFKRNKKRGRLTILPCMECGSLDVEGHHPDYSQPLSVVWLCKEHHQELHTSVTMQSL